MVKVLILMSLLAALAMPNVVIAKSLDKVIYGSDNRQEVKKYGDRLFRKKAKSVAIMIRKSFLKKNKDVYELIGRTFQERVNLCEGERFSEQLSLGGCTGFLVGKNTLITAGHCAPSTEECQKKYFVFGFVKGKRYFSKKDIYTCKRVIRHQLDEGFRSQQRDWAVIELDRPVRKRKPLKFRKRGAVKVGAELVLIGHPAGLPQKIADKAFVRKGGTDIYMVASTDSYGGNSGSPVFNERTGLVEGILVRGERDFEFDWVNSCMRSKVCKQNECMGEVITRITALKLKKSELKKKKRKKNKKKK